MGFSMFGAVDKLSKDAIRSWRGTDDGIDGSASQCRDWMLICCYGASLLLTYINENVGMRMYYAEHRDAGWYRRGPGQTSEPVISADFDAALVTWHALDVLRLLLPLVAWAAMLADTQCQLYQFK